MPARLFLSSWTWVFGHLYVWESTKWPLTACPPCLSAWGLMLFLDIQEGSWRPGPQEKSEGQGGGGTVIIECATFQHRRCWPHSFLVMAPEAAVNQGVCRSIYPFTTLADRQQGPVGKAPTSSAWPSEVELVALADAFRFSIWEIGGDAMADQSCHRCYWAKVAITDHFGGSAGSAASKITLLLVSLKSCTCHQQKGPLCWRKKTKDLPVGWFCEMPAHLKCQIAGTLHSSCLFHIILQAMCLCLCQCLCTSSVHT